MRTHRRTRRCDHQAILPVSTGTGRCLECGAAVPVPAWLHASA